MTRRWVPWRRRLKGVMDSAPDLGMGGLGDDPISAVIGIFLLILALPFLLLVLVAGLELLALFAVFPFALLLRVVFGQHWTIEARRGFRIVWQDASGDWQASGVRIRAVCEAIENGQPPPTNL